MRTVVSADPEAKIRPFGENDTQRMYSVWLSLNGVDNPAVLHMCKTSSSEVNAKKRPLGAYEIIFEGR